MKLSRMYTLAVTAAVCGWMIGSANAWCNPDPLVCGDVITTNLHSGNTHDDINTYNCTGSTTYNGNAHVYRIYPPSDSPMWITLEWTEGPTQYYDLHLFVLGSCNRNNCIAHDEHEIYFPEVNAGDDYWIIVDGRGNSADNQSYTLSVHCGDIPLSAELTAFDASRSNGAVNLSWTVASETNNERFELTRQSVGTAGWDLIARLDGRGTTSEGATYYYRDVTTSEDAAYRYRLTTVDFDGARQDIGYVNVMASAEASLPMEYRLVGNYPNPFNPSTNIVLEIAETSDVSLDVFSIDGRLVRTLVSGTVEAGVHEITFDAAIESAGMYFARLSGKSGSQMMKMILLK